MRPLDSERLASSYLMLLGTTTPETRKELWDAGRKAYPELAGQMWEHFRTIPEGPEFGEQRDRISGAMFLFLALVNATLDEPVIDGAWPKASSFPRLGKLPPLD